MSLGKIRGIGKVRKIAKISEIHRPRKAKVDPIPAHPRSGVRYGVEEDKLEKAALQGVPGTLPERIIWKWLLDHDYSFIGQYAESGGNLVVGGAVVDFLVYDIAGKPTAMRIMGDYWHGPKFPTRQARDDEQYYRLVSMGYLVVDLWEHDIYDAVKRDRLTPYIMDAVFSA
jgi:hypothetical protein